MKRSPLPTWQADKARTAKALRESLGCATPGCPGKALGIMLGSDLCVTCQIKRLRAQRANAPRET